MVVVDHRVPCGARSMCRIALKSMFHVPYMPSLQQTEVHLLLQCQLRCGRQSLPCTRHEIHCFCQRYDSSFHHSRQLVSTSNFHPHEVPFQGLRCIDWYPFTSLDATSNFFGCCCCQTQVGIVQSLSGPCFLAPLAWTCAPSQVGDSVSASSKIWVTHSARRWQGRFSHLFPDRCHVTCPKMHRPQACHCRVNPWHSFSSVCWTMITRALDVRADCQRR